MAERCVAILGPGLLGGSVALACQDRLPGTALRIWARRPDALKGLSAFGIEATACQTMEDCIHGASLIILATPVESMLPLAKQMAAANLETDAIITDVGSVKGPLARDLTPLLDRRDGPAFLGSHPMAGSEKAGIEAARANLFEGATCVVTPTESSQESTIERVSGFWSGLGSKVLTLSPEEHDRHVARISHLPHLLASVITRAALRSTPEASKCVGSGFRDTTRIAAGDPDLWTGIVRQNRTEILNSLKEAASELTELIEIIESVDDETLRRFLAEAKQLRDSIPAAPSNHGHPQS
jgi:prephenate dehydrogenase